MSQLTTKLNLDKDFLIKEGYLSEVKHPTEELYLYNYTQKAQFEAIWSQYPEVRNCRGLIIDGQGNIVARPFPKFHNFEEYCEGSKIGILPPYNSFEVYDKLDGSLGIVYRTSEGVSIATRGSFTSEQALWATQFLRDNYPLFIVSNGILSRNHTWLFEIIYPENRIVVDYKGEKKLVLLSIIDNETGLDMSRDSIEIANMFHKFPIVEKFDGISDFKQVRELVKRDNAEGFVILFDNGLRVKLKYEEYVRLHRIVTGISSKSIWDMLRNGQSFDEILECVPDEFHEWVNKIRHDLVKKWSNIMSEANKAVGMAKTLSPRKYQAEYILNNHKSISGVVFSMLDERYQKAEESAWKLIEPEYEQPFKTGIEN